jgi:periplasmic protein TonB
MASTEKIVPLLPDTLPEDFSEWDGNAPSAPAPTTADEWDAVIGPGEPPTSKPRTRTDYLNDILTSFDDKSRVRQSNSQPPNRVRQENPSTEWEKEAPAAPSPANGSEWEASPAHTEARKTGEPSAEPKVALSPALDKPIDEWPTVSEPVFSKPQKLNMKAAEEAPSQASSIPEAGKTTTEPQVAAKAKEPSAATAPQKYSAAELSKASAREADNTLFQAFSTRDHDIEEERKTGNNKRLVVVAAGAAAVLIPLGLIFAFGHHGTKAAVSQPMTPAAATTDTSTDASASETPLNQAVSQDKPSAATKAQTATDSEPTQKETPEDSSSAVSERQTQMMNDQLTAPRMISGDMKKQAQVAENAPPPEALGAGAAEGLGGNAAMGKFIGGNAQPIVQSAKPVAISSGVATGMLIQRTPPIYPTIAKTARVSGTVELEATISKTGTIKDLRVVSGPTMLRQAAADAVRTWRYKPYKLNNEPTEVETTVNVVFTLGN